jgi:hypothetical protein
VDCAGPEKSQGLSLARGITWWLEQELDRNERYFRRQPIVCYEPSPLTSKKKGKKKGKGLACSQNCLRIRRLVNYSGLPGIIISNNDKERGNRLLQEDITNRTYACMCESKHRVKQISRMPKGANKGWFWFLTNQKGAALTTLKRRCDCFLFVSASVIMYLILNRSV